MEMRTATVGTRAPAFSLTCTQGPGSARKQVSLDHYADRWMLTGRYAREKEHVLELFRDIAGEDPTLFAAQVPEPFAGILGLALAADPTQRITMAQIAQRLG